MIDATNCEIYVLGDMNIDYTKVADPKRKYLKQMERATGLRQLVNDTTRYSTVNTTIDLIFTNSDCIANSGVLNVNLSDHQAIYVTRKKSRVRNEKQNLEAVLIAITRRKYLKQN